MFSRVVGFGAQALVMEVLDSGPFADVIASSSMPQVHKQQIANRGLVAKIVRSDSWNGWFTQQALEDVRCPNKMSSSTVERQLRTIPLPEMRTMTRCAHKIASMHSNFVISYVHVVATETELRILMPRYSTTLQQWAQKNHDRVSEASLLKIGSQLALGLIDLHDEGIFHLDFHGDNVFVANSKSSEPHCVIADLEASYYDGISSNVPDAFTEPFAAPERGRVSPPQVKDREGRGVALEQTLGKCDVWSLGLLLYSIAANHDFPGLAEKTSELGSILMNHPQLTPTRIAAIVRRDLTSERVARGSAPYSDGFVSLLTMMLNHDALTRPSLFMVLEALQCLADSQTRSGGSAALKFPMCLGPFTLQAVADPSLLEVYPQSCMYDLHASCFRCGVVRSASRRQRSDCSNDVMHLPSHASASWQPVVPDSSAGQALQPAVVTTSSGRLGGGAELHDRACAASAQPMCFLYPFACDSAVSSRLLSMVRTEVDCHKRHSVVVALLQLQGGFAVLPESVSDATSSCVPRHVLTILPHVDTQPVASSDKDSLQLCFGAAQPWPSACNTVLRQAGRIHSEVPSLLGTTAKCFCWLLPGEMFQLPNGEMWVPAPHGGFVFWFEVDAVKPHELDRYFPVCEAPSPPASASAAARSPLLGIGRTVAGAAEAIGRSVVDAVKSALTGRKLPDDPGHSTTSASAVAETLTPSATDMAPLTDRTPAGRLHFCDLDAVSPALVAAGEVPMRSSSPHMHIVLPGSSPEFVRAVLQPNLQVESVSTIVASGPPSQANTAPPSVQCSRTTSRDVSQQHCTSLVVDLPPGVFPPRYPSVESDVRRSEGSLNGARPIGSEVGSHMTMRAGRTQPPPSDADGGCAAASLKSSNASSLTVLNTRAASLECPVVLPPQTRLHTPTHDSSERSVSTSASPMFSLPQPHRPTQGDVSEPQHTGALFGSLASSSVTRPQDSASRESQSWTVHSKRSSNRDVRTEDAAVPELYARLHYPFHRVRVVDGGLSGRRFHLIATNEYGSCGPFVSVNLLPLLCMRLGLSPAKEHKDVVHVCFCAVDGNDGNAAQISTSDVGQGGPTAAAVYCGRERALQHHGLLLVDALLNPVGLVAFTIRMVGSGLNAAARHSGFGGGAHLSSDLPVPLTFRGAVSVTETRQHLPVGVFADFDPFLVSPIGAVVLGKSANDGSDNRAYGHFASQSAPQLAGGSLAGTSTFNSAAGTGVPSLTATLTELQAAHQLARRASFGPDETGGLEKKSSGQSLPPDGLYVPGKLRCLAMDLHRSMFYFSDQERRAWLEFSVS